jgi:hypothetical protein
MKSALVCCLAMLFAYSAIAQNAADLNKSTVKDGKTYSYKEGMPYVEKGVLKNPAPEFNRETTPIEKAVQKVIDAPVTPTVVNGQPRIKYQKSFP